MSEKISARRASHTEDPDLVRLYLDDIGRHDLLTKEGEIELAKTIEAGVEARARLDESAAFPAKERRDLRRAARRGDVARDRFLNANLRLVVSIAKKYQGSGMPLLDLVQEGNLGLLRAVEKFDWRKGFKFSTYATWWIRQAIQRGVAHSARTIRLPVHVEDQLNLLRKTRAELAKTLDREPTAADIAAAVDMPVDTVSEVLQAALPTSSLDAPLTEDSDSERGDFIADPNAIDPEVGAYQATLPREVSRLLSVLEDREQRIVRMRFGLDGSEQTLAEVGDMFGLTRERIRQIEARTLSKLRHPSINTGARELLLEAG